MVSLKFSPNLSLGGTWLEWERFLSFTFESEFPALWLVGLISHVSRNDFSQVRAARQNFCVAEMVASPTKSDFRFKPDVIGLVRKLRQHDYSTKLGLEFWYQPDSVWTKLECAKVGKFRLELHKDESLISFGCSFWFKVVKVCWDLGVIKIL